MKGNTKKVSYIGFAACWARGIESGQKRMQLPSSRQDGSKGINAPEYKHAHRSVQRLKKSGGIPRGKAYAKMCRLGYQSESRKDLIRSTQ